MIWQTQANRAKFAGMRIDEFARQVERACQLADRHGNGVASNRWRGVEQICGRSEIN